jgi:hypothetical protein
VRHVGGELVSVLQILLLEQSALALYQVVQITSTHLLLVLEFLYLHVDYLRMNPEQILVLSAPSEH